MSTHVNGETSTDCSGLQIELQTFPAGEKKNSLFGGWFCSFMSTVYHRGLSFVSFCYTNEILSMLCATYQNKLRIFVYCVYIVFPLCSASVYEISSS